MTSNPLVSVNLESVKYFRAGAWHQALESIRFDVAKGEAVGIVGESGSGKSTLLYRLLGYEPHNSRTDGYVRLAGDEVLGAGQRALNSLRGKSIAFVPQNPLTSLAPHLKIGSQLVDAQTVHGSSKPLALARALELLEAVKIPAPNRALHKYPHEFSGGQLQRIVIAMAMTNQPSVLVLDEPTTGLDVTTQARILEVIKDVRTEYHTALIYVSHDLGVIREVCDRALVMYRGRVVEEGAVHQIFAAPRHLYTRRLLAAMPTLGARVPESVSAEDRSRVMLRVGDLHVTYGGRGHPKFQALSGVDLTVGAGEIVALVGESGSGKSTLARAITGLVKPRSGFVEINGQRLAGTYDQRPSTARRLVQLVPQNPDASLNPAERVDRILAAPLRKYFKLRGAELANRVAALLASVQLDASFARRFPRDLSGGERQRVAIARALAAEPTVLLCDEVLSALDVSTQLEIRGLLAELVASRGLAVLFVSHDLSTVEQFAHRVLVLYRGSLCQAGSTEQVFNGVRHPYTTELISSIPGVSVNVAEVSEVMPAPHLLEATCHYAHRCPLVVPGLCDMEVPPLVQADEANAVWCHRPKESVRLGIELGLPTLALQPVDSADLHPTAGRDR